MNTQPFVGTPNQSERYKNDVLVYKQLSKAIYGGLRVAMPGIVQSFDPDTQTVTVDIAVKDKIINNGVIEDIQIPTLLDVPLVMPIAGNFILTMPVQPGDECLVIFADMCINSWWQNGTIQNQETIRRHDLSDGFAILGTWSQPNKISNYSTDSAQLRSLTGNTIVEVADTSVNIIAGTVTIQSSNTVNVTASNHVNINGSGHTTIEGKDFLTHTHNGVQSGGGVSGPVT